MMAALDFAGRLRRDGRGTSTVEFALLTPALLFRFLAMLDIGMAAGEQMAMDRALKVASHAAMSDPGESRVMDVLRKSAAKPGAAPDEIPPMSVAVSRYCGCPIPDGDLERTSCDVMCNETTPATALYEIRASKRFDGVLIPAVPLRSTTTVHVR